MHLELAEVAAQCLAYGGNIYPQLWYDYCGGDESGMGTEVMVRVVKNAAARLMQIVVSAKSDAGQQIDTTHGTYAGFDIRDVREFGLTGMQDVIDAYHASKGQASMSAEQTQTQMLILLMIISKCLEARSSWIGSEVEAYRSYELVAKKTSGSELTETETRIDTLVSSLLGTVRVLYNVLRNVQEDVYLSCIKAISFINFQFPPRDSKASNYSTEVFVFVMFYFDRLLFKLLE